jgi:hypothetical protein
MLMTIRNPEAEPDSLAPMPSTSVYEAVKPAVARARPNAFGDMDATPPPLTDMRHTPSPIDAIARIFGSVTTSSSKPMLTMATINGAEPLARG